MGRRSSRMKHIISMEKIQISSKRSNPEKTTAKSDDEDDLDLPRCHLFEVLLLLPLKSVFKFRLVSKRWLSVASDPIFIRAYTSRASPSSSHWIALSPHVSTEKSLKLNHPSNSLELRVSYLRPPPPRPHRIRLNGRDVAHRCSIAGASDGLVLYCYTSQISGVRFFDFCVCDPFTGRGVRPLGRMTGSRLKPAWGFLARVDGRDFALKSYRIVHAAQRAKKPGSAVFRVYYSETGAWSKFKAALGTPSRRLELQESADALEGVLYWAEAGRGVVAFDPEAEPGRRVRVIRDPRGGERRAVWNPRVFGKRRLLALRCRRRPPPYPSVCVAHRGELRYFGWDAAGGDGAVGFRVWRLDGSGEWSLVHGIDGGRVGVRSLLMGLEMRSLHVTCFDPLDPNKAYLMNGHGGGPALAYDMEREEFDGGGLGIAVYCWFCTCGFLETHVLVVPPWPVRVSEKHLERRRGRFDSSR